METVLKDKTCFICGFKFRVVDLRNWVCNKCYYHETPKYTADERRKKIRGLSIGRFETQDPTLLALIIEEARESGGVKTAGEARYRDYICESLREHYIKYTTELGCENGRIDIFIEGVERYRVGKHWVAEMPPKIIEVKISDTNNHLTSALGQLLFYGQSYPQAQLYIATPMHLNRKTRRIFGLYGIEEWEDSKTEASEVWLKDGC